MKNAFCLTRSARYATSHLGLMTLALLLVLLTGCGTVDVNDVPESGPESSPAQAPAITMSTLYRSRSVPPRSL